MSDFSIENLSMSFGGLKAVNDVSFRASDGEVFSVIGPNGAGKTTIFNCISGLYKPDQGKILYDDLDLVTMKPHQIAMAGVARTFQNIELFGMMNTIENLLVAQHIHQTGGVLSGAFLTKKVKNEERKIRERAEEILEFLNLTDVAYQLAGGLPFGIQKRIELGRALALNPKVLLLDEPAAGLNPQEVEEKADLIREIRETYSLTVLLVEHDMRLVMGISDRITVINFGSKIAEGSPSEIQNNHNMHSATFNEERKNLRVKQPPIITENQNRNIILN